MIFWVLLFLAIVCFVIFSLRFPWWRKSISDTYTRVLMYHMVREHLPKNESKFNRLRVTPKNFEKQILWLAKNGYKSYFLSELNSQNLPPKSVVITFDDGYRDNLTNALPVLQKYGFKANIFIVVNRFDKNWASDKDLKISSDELNAEEMLSHEEVKTLLDSGLIEIGSHTLNHANLPSLSESEKEREITLSKGQIEQIYGIKCDTFAYPFGFYDEKSVEIAKNSYKFSVTTKNDVLKKEYANSQIPRLMVSGKMGLLGFILLMKKGRRR